MINKNYNVELMSDAEYRHELEKFYNAYNNKIGFPYLMNESKLKKFTKTRERLREIADFDIYVDTAYVSLYHQYHTIGDKKLNLDPGQWSVFNVDRNVNYIRIMIEMLKISNDNFILYKSKNLRGDIKLYDIASKINYDSNEEKKLLKDLFFIEIRNALSHMDYNWILDDHKKFDALVWYEKEKIYKNKVIKNRVKHKYQLNDIKSVMGKIKILIDVQKNIFRYIADINALYMVKMWHN